MQGREKASFQAQVSVVPAYEPTLTLETDTLLQLYNGSVVLDRDIINVSVSNSLSGHGRWSIDLAPRDIGNGSTIADLLRPYSLVTIRMQHDDPLPVTMTVGLLDRCQVIEQYSSGVPQRQIRISGRSLSAILVDHSWWFHHYLAAAGQETIVPPDFRGYYEDWPSGREVLTKELRTAVLSYLAIDPELYDPTEREPIHLIGKTFDFFVNGVDGRDPFIRVKFMDGRTLGSILRFSEDEARESYFDPTARLTQRFLPTGMMPEANAWSIMRGFSPEQFTEMFADAFEDERGNEYVGVVVRKPPWLGHIVQIDDYGEKKMAVGFSSAAGPPNWGESLFDGLWGGWIRAQETITVPGHYVVSRDVTRGLGGDVKNLYFVTPACWSGGGNSKGQKDLGQMIPPIIDEDPESPSFVQRYGIRPMKLALRTVPAFKQDDETPRPVGEFQRQCLSYEALLHEWNHRNPDMWNGSMTMRGDPQVRIGRRLLDESRNREYYIHQVTHQMHFGGAQPRYITTAGISRGWNLYNRESFS